MLNKIKLKITKGAPIVNFAYIEKKSKSIVCIVIDMKSKYCFVDADGCGDNEGPSIYILANRESLYLNKRKQIDSYTVVYFTEYKNWSVFSGSSSKYSIRITLIRD